MDGIIIINKPKGCTSHDIVHKAKKIFNEKVGHTGTLDPMATGVLPLLIGKGTLCSKYLIEHDKIYKAKIQLGVKTDTADQEGNIIEKSQVDDSIFNIEKIKNTLKNMIGKNLQTPPIYSAIKVKGKKLYEYARKGENVEIPKREITIYDIELTNIDEKNKTIEFKVHCSKGTYIRSLCEDIATNLGTIGYMSSLQRVKVVRFSIENSITIDDLEKNIKNDSYIKNHFISIEKLFENEPNIELNNRKLELFLNGVKLTWQVEDGIYKIYNNGNFIGIGTVKNNLLKRDIII